MRNCAADSSDEALAEEIARYGPALLPIARHILGDLHLAEDAVAETFMNAWVKRDSLRDRRNLGHWLSRICRNQAMSIRRRYQRKAIVLGDETLLDRPATSAGGNCAEYEVDLLARLPDALKTCAQLFFIDGQSYSEVAMMVGLPLSTVRGRIHLSRERMRKEIQMSKQRISAGPGKPETIDAEGKQLDWRGARIRLLGVTWSGSGRLYDAAGRRMPRLPVILQKSDLLRRPFTGDFEGREAHKLSVFWEVRGEQSILMHAEASAGQSGQVLLPSGVPSEMHGASKVVCLMCGEPAAEVREVRLKSTLLGPVDTNRVFRFVPEGDFGDKGLGWTGVSGAAWGALIVTDRRLGPKPGTCTFTVAFSSTEAEQGCRILAIGPEEQEVEPLSVSGGRAASMAGHLHVETLDVPLAPEEVAGVAIYPRFMATVDWGRVRVPPKSPARGSVRPAQQQGARDDMICS